MLALFLALYLVALRGHTWLGVGLALPVAWQLRALCRQPMAGAILHWRGGEWMVERAGCRHRIRLQQACRVSPLGIHLCWQREASGRDGPVRESAWLFADSGPPHELRRLRVRLALER